MILAVSNQKGGVGKTTTAINLSALLAKAGKRTLLIDLDPQGNATTGLGLPKNKPGVYQALVEEMPLRDTVLPSSVPGLSVIPANTALSGATVEMVALEGREKRLKRALDRIKNDFDYLLIDCPPSLDLLTVNAFTAADRVLVPIQCEFYALEGLGQLMNTVKLIRQKLNPALTLDGVVMTMFDSRTNLSEQVVTEVRKYFGDRVYKARIPRNVRLAEAPSFGQPISQFDAYCPGALAYKELCREFLERNEQA